MLFSFSAHTGCKKSRGSRAAFPYVALWHVQKNDTSVLSRRNQRLLRFRQEHMGERVGVVIAFGRFSSALAPSQTTRGGVLLREAALLVDIHPIDCRPCTTSGILAWFRRGFHIMSISGLAKRYGRCMYLGYDDSLVAM